MGYYVNALYFKPEKSWLDVNLLRFLFNWVYPIFLVAFGTENNKNAIQVIHQNTSDWIFIFLYISYVQGVTKKMAPWPICKF